MSFNGPRTSSPKRFELEKEDNHQVHLIAYPPSMQTASSCCLYGSDQQSLILPGNIFKKKSK